ncbi:hypothetical protein Pla52n_26950 [Stieleria varia]|uniref:Uncharacterized protein n=1 Tax=Stieleria varia TaxID=2528005 RepID=A0A5C6AXI7_9BACT|nr:hypothetical protein Pla52n_26950 [Stieleria varia]
MVRDDHVDSTPQGVADYSEPGLRPPSGSVLARPNRPAMIAALYRRLPSETASRSFAATIFFTFPETLTSASSPRWCPGFSRSAPHSSPHLKSIAPLLPKPWRACSEPGSGGEGLGTKPNTPRHVEASLRDANPNERSEVTNRPAPPSSNLQARRIEGRKTTILGTRHFAMSTKRIA